MGGLLSCVALNLCECAACMACGCCSSLISMTLSQAARLGHLIVYILAFSAALILGRHYQQNIVEDSQYTYYYVDVSTSLNIATLYEGCSEEYYEECVFRQLIFRTSFALFLFFFSMLILTSCSDYINRSMWTLKIMIVIGLSIAFWYGTNDFFTGWAEVCRIVSFVWLLIQSLLILDIGFDLHDIVLSVAGNDADWASGFAKVGYLVLTALFFSLAITGYVYLFGDYYGCESGKAFIVVTLVFTIIQMLVSMLNAVNRGILTPAFMMAYAVFMCWYALLSNPEEACNPSADVNNGHAKNTSVAFVSIISLIVLLFCVFNGSIIMQIFMPNGEGVLESNYGGAGSRPVQSKDGSLDGVLTGDHDPSSSSTDTIPHQHGGQYATNQPPDASGGPRERMFYHGMMMIASCYGATILTSWGKSDGSPESVGNVETYAGATSMWLKIISQWVFLLIYGKALHAAYVTNNS